MRLEDVLTLIKNKKGLFIERQIINEPYRSLICARDGHKCRYCGTPVTKFHLDHIHPYTKWGSDLPWNLATSCETCNLRKGAQVDGWLLEPVGIGHTVMFYALFILCLYIGKPYSRSA